MTSNDVLDLLELAHKDHKDICKKYGVVMAKKPKAKLKSTGCQTVPQAKNSGTQTNNMKAHWDYLRQTKNLKNRTELKKYLTGKKRSPLKYVEKAKKVKKIPVPPTKKSENGLEISESD